MEREFENNLEKIKVDLLVIGSEGAGAKIAIEAHQDGIDTLVVTKGVFGRSGATLMAGRGVQACIGHMDPHDNPDVFLDDVVKGGAYLNNQKLAERLVDICKTEVPKLEDWGAKFMKKPDGKFYQLQLPGSSYARTLNAIGPGGIQWRRAFKNQFEKLGIQPLEDTFITSLLLNKDQVAGAIGISLRDGHIIIFQAKYTVMATGGCGQIYLMTDTPADATGDGMILAYKAGAEIMDMEFQQFYPIMLYAPYAFRGVSAGSFRYGLHPIYFNSEGEQFMDRYEPLAKSWGLRDPTSRAIYLENKYGRGSPAGGAYLSGRHIPRNVIQSWLDRWRPMWVMDLKKLGIDIFEDALEVGPGCHYSCGGIRVNENCETSLPRLYAAGEVASGMDGAERIDGGPAITWTQTMGYIVEKEVAKKVKDIDYLPIDQNQVKEEVARLDALWNRKEGVRGHEIKNKLKKIMWEQASLVRNGKGLEEALTSIKQIKEELIPKISITGSSKVFNVAWKEALEAVNLSAIAEAITRSALMRTESRKSHYRDDFPIQDDANWIKNIVITRKSGQMSLSLANPVITKIKPPTVKEVKK
jgi:fumarate reductase (CoM/CoB) subunit A